MSGNEQVTGTLGPNEPCHCGSGKKYKRCHLPRERLAEALATHAAPAEASPAKRSKPVQRGRVSPPQPIPPEIPRPDYAATGSPRGNARPSFLRTQDQIERMRRACQAARAVLEITKRAVAPGVTTDALDRIAHEACIARGGYPSPLNYHGFPKSICTSVNEVICHGIPDSRPLEEGDIVNLDVTIYLEGMHGDLSETVRVGKVDELSDRLVRVTQECLMLGIEQVRADAPLSNVGKAIEAHATRHGFSVVREFVGHGIGESFHAEPQVPHYYDPSLSTIMRAGMTFTLEPMINVGVWRHVILDDNWTAVTADLQRSAQFEHTLLVTERGVEVLTLPQSS